MPEPTRRTVLAGIATSVGVGLGSLSGCTTQVGDHPPIDADYEDLETILAIEPPTVPTRFPIEPTESFIDAGMQRVRGLLEPIPTNLSTAIPNEAVRTYIDEERNRALDSLQTVEEGSVEFATISPLRSARIRAAEAHGAYLAANGERTRESVYDDLEPTRRRLDRVVTDLTCTGDDPVHTVIVYDQIERELQSATSAVENADQQSVHVSEVEAVGDAMRWLETVRARLDTVSHLIDRQAERVDAGRSFDDQFSELAAERLDTIRESVEAFPPVDTPPEDLFEVPVDGTARDQIGRDVLRSVRWSADRVEDSIADEWTARSLRYTFDLEHAVRSGEALLEWGEKERFDRPTDTTPIMEEKVAAIEAVESAVDQTDPPGVLRWRESAIAGAIRRGDDLLERVVDMERSNFDRQLVNAHGYYAIASARASTVAETANRFVADLRG